MRRTAHILLALFAGILLQASLVGVAGAGQEQSGAVGKLGLRLVDLGSLLDPDLPDAPQPYLGGGSPKPFALTSAATAILPAGDAVDGVSPRPRSALASRPIYLTTLRLRL